MIFKWMNESEINIEGDKIEITAPPRTDFFVEVLMNVKIEHKTVKNNSERKIKNECCKKN